MGRYVNDAKDRELLYVADNAADLAAEVLKIQQLVDWGNRSLQDSGYDQMASQYVDVRGMKVYIRLAPSE
jgi:hypothetical protein